MVELSPAEWTAVALSLRIALVATAWALPFGVAIGWLLARRNFWGKTVLDGLVHLPLVLPPVVTGYLLLIAFGRKGPRGDARRQSCLRLSHRDTAARPARRDRRPAAVLRPCTRRIRRHHHFSLQ